MSPGRLEIRDNLLEIIIAADLSDTLIINTVPVLQLAVYFTSEIITAQSVRCFESPSDGIMTQRVACSA